MTEKKRIFTVLAIDGGGVRGIIPARILQELEQRTGKPVAEMFDLIGGTSTGAIVAAGLVVPDDQNPAKPKYTAEYLKDLYFQHAPRIFPEMKFKSLRQLSSSSAYDPRPLEETLESYFGDKKMKDSLTHLMIPVTDIKHFRPAWINYIKGTKDTSPEGWSSMLLKDAVRATTTAPTYFPAKYFETTPNENVPGVTQRHALIDGGFFGSNAMRRMLTQARKLAPPDADIVVVHLGTGNIDNSLSPDEWNRLGPLGMISKSKGSIFMTLVTNMTMLDVADDLRDELGDHFLSFNANIDFEDTRNSPNVAMDDASLRNMKLLEQLAEKLISDNDNEVNRLCHMLEQRIFAEKYHANSRESLQKLVAKMDEAKTVKSLNRIYREILRCSSDLEKDKLAPVKDAEIKCHAESLSEKHKQELYRIYNVMLDKLENQNRMLNAVKETGDNVNNFLKKLAKPFNDKAAPKKDAAPPADNDNKPPAPSVDQPPQPKKKGFWFGR